MRLPSHGGMVNTAARTFPTWGEFPSNWLANNINQKEIQGAYHLLRQFCTQHPAVLRRALDRGRASNCEIHALRG